MEMHLPELKINQNDIELYSITNDCETYSKTRFILFGYLDNQKSIFADIDNITDMMDFYYITNYVRFHFYLDSLIFFTNIKILNLAILYSITLSMSVYNKKNEYLKFILESKHSTYKSMNPYMSLNQSKISMQQLMNETSCRTIIEYVSQLRPDIRFTWNGISLF